MKTYLQQKEEIEAFSEVGEVLRAEEKISASNIHFLRKKTESLNYYIKLLEESFSRFIQFYFAPHPLLLEKKGKRVLLIISGDRGMVGGLWHNIIEMVLSVKKSYDIFIVYGKKGRDYLIQEGVRPVKIFLEGEEDIPSFSEIRVISDYLVSSFISEKWSKIDIVYPRFFTLLFQQPELVTFLPFTLRKEDLYNRYRQEAGFPIFEPKKSEVFNFFLNEHIKNFLLKIFVEARLSELAARTVTTENASSQTKILIKEMRRKFFKERRNYISQKQIESFSVHKLCQKI